MAQIDYLIWEATKDPNEVKDFKVDWTDRLAGQTIYSSEWTIISGGDRLEIDQQAYNSTSTTIWLSGGRVGTCVLLNRIKDNATPRRTYDQSVKLYVRNK